MVYLRYSYRNGFKNDKTIEGTREEESNAETVRKRVH
jgi:hypothetical protein